MLLNHSHVPLYSPLDPSRTKQGGKTAVLVENVAFFSKMLVEKLYSGMFVVEPENLLVFMAEQIAVVSLSSDLSNILYYCFKPRQTCIYTACLYWHQALERGHGNREITVSVLYKNLNRALLYFLSRPRQTPAEQELIVQTLRMLQQHWDVIMATYNANVHFIICLMHCLVLIRSGRWVSLLVIVGLFTNRLHFVVLFLSIKKVQHIIGYKIFAIIKLLVLDR